MCMPNTKVMGFILYQEYYLPSTSTDYKNNCTYIFINYELPQIKSHKKSEYFSFSTINVYNQIRKLWVIFYIKNVTHHQLLHIIKMTVHTYFYKLRTASNKKLPTVETVLKFSHCPCFDFHFNFSVYLQCK